MNTLLIALTLVVPFAPSIAIEATPDDRNASVSRWDSKAVSKDTSKKNTANLKARHDEMNKRESLEDQRLERY